MLAVRDAISKARDLAKAEFATLRLKLFKIAARVIEMASRVRPAFSGAYSETMSPGNPFEGSAPVCGGDEGLFDVL